ncbi:MAG: menaquinone biosynthesis decarboxylase [Candidatus Krumholzibacteria bacterium]|nr:menaquinone biosynthesis decarboxylase [Candidatus Krumholzibacteria bacterium]
MSKTNAAGIPVHDLQSFVKFLEEKGELIRITEPVDPVLEVTEIADRFVKNGENPALLFENPTPGKYSEKFGRTEIAKNADGNPVPLLINLYASEQRMAWALGCNSIAEAVAKIEEPLKMGPPDGLWGKVRMLGKLKGWGEGMPKTVGKGACQEVVVQGKDLKKRGLLDMMPVLTTWPGDGGPYITTPLVITRNPENGKRNIGMYRMQVFDGQTTGMHWQIHKTGAAHHAEYEKNNERMPVCVAIGGPPVMTYAATAPLPPDIDEALFAGFLTGEPVKMCKAITNDLEVPADADFIIEGYVEPGERRMEGDFGDHTGWYSLAEEFPVFHVTAITSRRNPTYLTTMVGRPPMEDGWLGLATERLFLPLLKVPLPEVVDYHLPVAACFHNLVIIAIKKRYPGHARKVCMALWGTGQIMFTKTVIVVDEDVNPQDVTEVLWRVTGSMDPARDVFFSEGPVDQLDHSTNLACYGGKMGVDGTRKIKGEKGYEREWPEVVEMDADEKADVDKKWADLLNTLKGGR